MSGHVLEILHINHLQFLTAIRLKHLEFTDEPLYQIYQAVALEKERTLSLKRSKKGDTAGTRGRTFTMGYGTMRGGKMLWSQLPEVSSYSFRSEHVSFVLGC